MYLQPGTHAEQLPEELAGKYDIVIHSLLDLDRDGPSEDMGSRGNRVQGIRSEAIEHMHRWQV